MEIIFGTWMEIGLFLFNIFLADLFFIVNKMDIANYADDDTPYATVNDMDSLIASLEETSKSLFAWFDNNIMKSNSDKCHLLVSSNEKSNNYNGGLAFDYHISEICKKASRKVCALARVKSCIQTVL